MSNQRKHDWDTIFPKIEALKAQGLSWEKITDSIKAEYPGLTRSHVYGRWKFELARRERQSPKREPSIKEPTAPAPVDDLQTVTLARKILHRAVLGDNEVTSAQINAAKSILSKEADVEFKSPYAGIPSEELCERILVCAVGLCGLPMVITKLRSLAASGTLQVSGMDGIEDIIGVRSVEAERPETEPVMGRVEEVKPET